MRESGAGDAVHARLGGRGHSFVPVRPQVVDEPGSDQARAADDNDFHRYLLEVDQGMEKIELMCSLRSSGTSHYIGAISARGKRNCALLQS